MSGYEYHGTGADELTPDLDEYAPDFPIPRAYRGKPYPEADVLTCAADAHAAFTTTDRDGAKFWACRRCPAVREFGDPAWRTP